MPKILFVSNTANFQKFNKPFMKWCKEQNWIVDYASPADESVTEYCDHFFDIEMARSPFYLFKNCRSVRELRKVIQNNHYDIIHCHTPVGAAITRLAAKHLWKQGKVKIIYTAHGFHFYKGAPLKYWFVFYPIEKYLSSFTDVLVTINNEDYNTVCNKHFKAKKIIYIDGVGVDTSRFTPAKSELERTELRKSYDYKNSDFVIIYIAEFIPRKDHEFLIQNISSIVATIPNAHFVFCGKGQDLKKMQNLAKNLHVDEYIDFLGYRKDIPQLCQAADLYVTTSRQEGLPISVIEAMASGLPIVASNIRGQTDCVKPGVNGELYMLYNRQDFVKKVSNLYFDKTLRENISKNNVSAVLKFSVDKAVNKIARIYKELSMKGSECSEVV